MSTKGLMTHIVAGYPSIKKCEEIAMVMAESGVKFLEIQIPFSDPIADGPVIMRANQAALDSGVRVEDCFELMKRLKEKFKERDLETQLLFMTYFNIVYKYGVSEFCKRAHECGAYGLIVPDIPIDEENHEHYLEFCEKNDLKPIQVISPLTSEKRLQEIAKVARGFVYCVSRYGTTGESMELNSKLSEYLDRVKKKIDLPIAVGFGISKPEHVVAVHKHAEIAVIGSKFINILNENSEEESIQKIKNLFLDFL